MNKKRLTLTAIVLILITVCGFLLFGRSSEATEILYTAHRVDFAITVESDGVLKAKNAISIATPRVRWAVPTINWMVPEGSRVKKGELVVDLEAAEIERRYLTAMDELAIAKADAEKGEAELYMEMQTLQAQLRETTASLQAARLQLSKIAFEPWRTQEITRLRIASDSLDVARIQQKLITLEQIQKEERAKLRLRIEQEERKVAVSKHNLGQLQLTSPVDGVVEYERSRRTGEKIAIGESPYPGMPLVKIPDLTIMQAQLRISETDAKKLQSGQIAEVTIPSLQKTISGKVDKVDKMAKPIKRGSRIKKVEVAVTLDSSGVIMSPGLTVRCKINTRTISDVIPLPYECVFEKDSTKIVYAQNGSSYDAIAVAVVGHGSDFLAVMGDIHEGQFCALREPNTNRVNWPDSLKVPVFESKPDSNNITSTVQQNTAVVKRPVDIKSPEPSASN